MSLYREKPYGEEGDAGMGDGYLVVLPDRYMQGVPHGTVRIKVGAEGDTLTVVVDILDTKGQLISRYTMPVRGSDLCPDTPLRTANDAPIKCADCPWFSATGLEGLGICMHVRGPCWTKAADELCSLGREEAPCAS